MRDATRLRSTRPALWTALLLSALPFRALAAPPDAPKPGEASGSFSVDGRAVTLRYAYAMTQPDVFDEKKTNTAILLTEKPLPESALGSVKDLESAGRDQTNWILVRLDEKGSAIREVVHHASLGDASLQMSGMTHSDVKANAGKDRVEGAVRTEGEEDFLHHKYRTDVRFNASIRQAAHETPLPDARTGKRLPPGGGEPGKAFFAFDEAVRKKDLAAIRRLKPAEMPDMSDKDLSAALEMMAAMSPAKITIDEGYANGDLAVLYVSGTQDGRKQYGTVRMNKVGANWLATDQKWSDKPPAK